VSTITNDRVFIDGRFERARQTDGRVSPTRMWTWLLQKCLAAKRCDSLLPCRAATQREGRWQLGIRRKEATAVDPACAAFAALMQPLPEADCPMRPPGESCGAGFPSRSIQKTWRCYLRIAIEFIVNCYRCRCQHKEASYCKESTKCVEVCEQLCTMILLLPPFEDRWTGQSSGLVYNENLAER
jgi:hypothetical protein